MDTAQSFLSQLGDYAPLVINAGKALIVLILGWIVASAVSAFVRRRVNASQRIDKTIGNFIASITRWLILLIVLIAILNLFGIEATSLVAMLGAATLAIGMAIQGTLADLAAGFMLILFRPYRIGEFVDVGGTSGTVKDINLFFTELATPDNIQIIVPNGQAWGSIITNYSHHSTRRVQLVFGISYDDNAETAMEVIRRVAEADERVHDDPAPWVRVTNLGDSSVDLTLRAWTDSADFWDVKFDLTRAIKEAFDAEGISIPYPHQVLIQARD
ncbi:mechanosensitive ion channel family protein [Maritimibacter fusiformis]|uniref:Small-conductance mechanosensitive channel n=1 Tax=Maritimibacter fusiformis TaxID=2603819 RepID=A0A5D0RM17_9RHOB|nr:mechanosensitive ion channel domain-containing protein [Maritimibacter fusiformis]TYB81986.1 mechanosensitive ion channel [Maritimibacter fusiformis]